MPKRLRIDPYALCASPFAAPVVLAAAGLLIGYSKSQAGFWSLLFWQGLYAFEFAPIFLVVTMPVSWLLSRFGFLPRVRTRSLAISIVLAVVTVAIASNLPFFAPNLNNDMAVLIMMLAGLGLNVLTFIWLSSPPNRTVEPDARDTARGSP